MNDATFWVDKLGLLPHPEGGFYKEMYRSNEQLKAEGLPKRFVGNRSCITSIYFLIKSGYPSHFHRIKSDEIWYFHHGSPITLHLIDAAGNYEAKILGNLQAEVDSFQLCIAAETWFAAEVTDNDAYALVSCAVAPGFDFQDFELAKAEQLKRICIAQTALIDRLTHD